MCQARLVAVKKILIQSMNPVPNTSYVPPRIPLAPALGPSAPCFSSAVFAAISSLPDLLSSRLFYCLRPMPRVFGTSHYFLTCTRMKHHVTGYIRLASPTEQDRQHHRGLGELTPWAHTLIGGDGRSISSLSLPTMDCSTVWCSSTV